MAAWRILLFGTLRIEGPDGSLDRFETRRSALCLIRLALSREGKASRETLADALWPDDFPDATRMRLRKELSRLRKALGPAEDVLWSDAEMVGLDLNQVTTDVHEFIAAVRQAGAAASGVERVERLRDALKLVGSPLLPGWDEPWIVGERTRIDAARLEALVEVAEYLVENGEPFEALTLVNQALEIDSAAERAHVVAMRAHAGLGSVADALSQYQLLKRALQAEPSAAAADLADRIGRGEIAHPVSDSSSDIPTPLDHLFGRDAELSALTTALAPGGPVRLLTIVGPGGMGKTRLSIAFAHAARDPYAGRVYFVPLADLSEAREIETQTAESIGAAAQGAAQPFEALALALGDRPTLLILDNLEHLIEPAARFVERLLHRLPTLRILATSRQALGLVGERETPLAPLDSESALRFFVSRAQAVRPAFAITPRNEAVLRTLVERLEGLPLAIHLAASRSHLLTPEQMLHQLDSRLSFLVGRSASSGERHRTIRGAIAWSYDLLTDAQRRMLRNLALFRGGWTLEAAVAVSGEEATLDLLGELVDRSLVVSEETEDGMRYRMLETIREYGLEGLSVEEEADLRRRHAEYYFQYVAQIHRMAGERLRWYRLLTADTDNIRDSLRWAQDHDRRLGAETMSFLWHFWNIRGLLGEGRSWARILLSNSDEFPPTGTLGFALAGAAIMARCQGDHSDALRWFEIARKVGEKTGDLNVLGFIGGNLPESLIALGDLDGAWHSAHEGIDFFQRAGNWEMYLSMMTLAKVHVARGEPDLAEPLLHEVLRFYEENGNIWAIGAAWHGLAEMHQARGELAEARECLIIAQARFESIYEIDSLSRTYLLRAQIDPAEAETYARKAIELCERLGVMDRLLEAEAALCRATRDPGPAAARLARTRAAASADAVAILNQALAEVGG